MISVEWHLPAKGYRRYGRGTKPRNEATEIPGSFFFSPFFTKERKSNILFIETAKIYFPFVVFVQHANIVCRLGYFFVIKKNKEKTIKVKIYKS